MEGKLGGAEDRLVLSNKDILLTPFAGTIHVLASGRGRRINSAAVGWIVNYAHRNEKNMAIIGGINGPGAKGSGEAEPIGDIAIEDRGRDTELDNAAVDAIEQPVDADFPNADTAAGFREYAEPLTWDLGPYADNGLDPAPTDMWGVTDADGFAMSALEAAELGYPELNGGSPVVSRPKDAERATRGHRRLSAKEAAELGHPDPGDAEIYVDGDGDFYIIGPDGELVAYGGESSLEPGSSVVGDPAIEGEQSVPDSVAPAPGESGFIGPMPVSDPSASDVDADKPAPPASAGSVLDFVPPATDAAMTGAAQPGEPGFIGPMPTSGIPKDNDFAHAFEEIGEEYEEIHRGVGGALGGFTNPLGGLVSSSGGVDTQQRAHAMRQNPSYETLDAADALYRQSKTLPNGRSVAEQFEKDADVIRDRHLGGAKGWLDVSGMQQTAAVEEMARHPNSPGGESLTASELDALAAAQRGQLADTLITTMSAVPTFAALGGAGKALWAVSRQSGKIGIRSAVQSQIGTGREIARSAAWNIPQEIVEEYLEDAAAAFARAEYDPELARQDLESSYVDEFTDMKGHYRRVLTGLLFGTAETLGRRQSLLPDGSAFDVSHQGQDAPASVPAPGEEGFIGPMPISANPAPGEAGFIGPLPVSANPSPGEAGFIGPLPVSTAPAPGESGFIGPLPVSANPSPGRAGFIGPMPISANPAPDTAGFIGPTLTVGTVQATPSPSGDSTATSGNPAGQGTPGGEAASPTGNEGDGHDTREGEGQGTAQNTAEESSARGRGRSAQRKNNDRSFGRRLGRLPPLGGVPVLPFGGGRRGVGSARLGNASPRIIQWRQRTRMVADLDTGQFTETPIGNPKSVIITMKDNTAPAPQVRYADVMKVKPSKNFVEVFPLATGQTGSATESDIATDWEGGKSASGSNPRVVSWEQETLLTHDLDQGVVTERALGDPLALRVVSTDGDAPSMNRRLMDVMEVRATGDGVSVRPRPKAKVSRERRGVAKQPKRGNRRATAGRVAAARR